MVKKWVFWWMLTMLIVLPSCAQWEELVEKSATIEQYGQATVEVGTATSVVQPEIGLWILTAGGLIIATAKMLSLFKKEENK